MKKFFVLILIPAILMGCTQYNLGSLGKNKCIYEEKGDYKLITSISDKNIFLYGKEERLSYVGMKLKIGENCKEFDWINTLNIMNYPPRLILADINNDGTDELIIILTAGYGTGIHEGTIKILDLNTMDEINIINPMDIIDKNIESKLTEEDISIKIGEEVYRLKTVDYTDDTKNLFNNIKYGSEIYFSVENDKIKSRVSVQITPGAYIGYFNINYKYKGNQLVLDNIIFDANYARQLNQ